MSGAGVATGARSTAGTLRAAFSHGDRRKSDSRPSPIWVAYGILGVLLAAYAVSLIVRSPTQQWPWLDSWTVAVFEIVASLMCIARGLTRQRGRAVAIFLGLSVLSWALGDLVVAIESSGGGSPSSPGLPDVFWLGFYPLAYVGTVFLLRGAVGRIGRPNWLDGVIAGLGAAGLCAAFAFRDVVHLAGSSTASTVTNLAYPIGDLLILSLVVGGSALITRDGKGPWLLLALGIATNVVGDTFNLFQSTTGFTRVGTAFNDIAWPVSILFISMAVWLRPVPADPLRPPKVAGFVLPGAGACIGLAVLADGTMQHLSRVALGIAIATLAAVGVRLAMSTRSLRILTERNHHHAVTDELTKLGNRRQLFQVLDTFFEDPTAPDRRLAFLFIDLNRFKEINDSFGHPAGDELLAQLGPRLTGAIRASDLAVRLGGDEFAVVLIDADADEAAAVALRIVEGLEAPFALQAMSARIGASIGIALVPENATDATGALWCADIAMYRAKMGSNSFAFYDPDVDGAETQLRLADELRTALDQGEFVLHYQPQLDLASGRVIAVEALIRWPHATLGVIPPLKFLPLAEEANLMQPLTAWVLDHALAQCAKWRAEGSHVAVSVNVSPTNLLDPSLADLVAELLERHGMPAGALVLEITETCVISDFEESQAAIGRLQALGVTVSIDDFGAGFTSLAHLSTLAVGELKLDGGFITGLGGGGKQRDLELVRATIELGHAMGLRVVAEGIEDEATLDLLRDLGCDLAQGYFISRPMPAEKLALGTASSTARSALVG